jgi:hypothetical protein
MEKHSTIHEIIHKLEKTKVYHKCTFCQTKYYDSDKVKESLNIQHKYYYVCENCYTTHERYKILQGKYHQECQFPYRTIMTQEETIEWNKYLKLINS